MAHRLDAAAACLPRRSPSRRQPPAIGGDPQSADQDLGGGPEGDILTRTRLFQLYYAVKTAPGSGPDGTIRTVTTDTFKLRGDTNIDLNSDWQLALRADLPFDAKDPYNSSNPNADFIHGLGDADIQGALVHQLDARWTVGGRRPPHHADRRLGQRPRLGKVADHADRRRALRAA